MSLYKLHTNEGERYVTQKPTFEQMARYIKAKRALGWKYGEIIFCWGPIHVLHNAESMVRTIEEKVKEEQVVKEHVANQK